MFIRSSTVKGASRAAARPVPGLAVRKKHNRVPDYEKPLVRTGEARLWRTLNVGDKVAVVREGNYRRTGVVDALTRDGITVWILLDDGRGRVAIIEGDGVALVPLQ